VTELDELLRRALEDRLTDLHTSGPGRIEAVYPDGTADVKPMIRRPVPSADGGFQYEEIPIIPKALVARLGTARSSIKFDVQPGDFVWLVFSELSTAEFFETQAEAEPELVSRHGLTGAFAIPICLSRAAEPVDLIALAAKVETALQSIEQWAGTHTHMVTSLGAPTAVAVPVLAPSSPVGAAGLGAE
jgi:hypothetical protein